ncbi:MAG: DUF202 domain-containing protein [Crocinitomicaceae bacterium]|nr:DUF202 domain-containing protein [Crocinitomicaceae bacterium]
MPKKKIQKLTGTQHLGTRYRHRDKIILRDFLALERTTLANERTLFSYIRAGIYMVLAGFAFMKIEVFSDMLWLSYSLFAFSALLIVYGFIRFSVLQKKLRVYYDAMEEEYKLEELAKKDKIQE